MRQARLAFSAAYWGNGAVVCRAKENCAGPAVVQEFGEFTSWSGAISFAEKLNEGLGLSLAERREIIVDAILATSDVLQTATKTGSMWKRAPVVVASEERQWESLHAQLDLAMTFCRIIDRRSDKSNRRVVEQILRAIDAAIELAAQKSNKRDLEQVCAKLCALERWRRGMASVEYGRAGWQSSWEGRLAPRNI